MRITLISGDKNLNSKVILDTMSEKVEKSEDTKKENTEYKKHRNPWVYSTVILLIIAVGLFVYPMYGGDHAVTGNVIAVDNSLSTSEITEVASDFFNERLSQFEGTVTSVEDTNGVYKIIFEVQGQVVPLYFTKDGYWIQQGAELVSATEPPEEPPAAEQPPAETGVVKTEKPVVELFVMSHCPYGTQAEKGIIPVMELLGDKIDASIKFVYYAMHPTQGEVEEQLAQYCIQEEQSEKYLNYLKCFLQEGDGEACLVEANIDTAKLETCTEATDTKFEITTNLEDQSLWLNGRFPQFNIHKELNQLYGVSGSPSLIVNGMKVNSGRDSASMLSTICSGFENPPEECNQELNAETPTPGFGYTYSDTASTASCE